MIVPVKTYVKVWAALVALLLLTVAVAFVNLGAFNLAVAMLVAAIKTALIVSVFMHLRGAPRLLQLVAGAGLLWLGFLLILMMNDYVTRHEAVWLQR